MGYNKEIFKNPKLEKAYQKIKITSLRGIIPVKHPVAVVLGGLPGSGKGNIYDFYDAKNNINGNIVHLDCDKFRRYHPEATSFSPEEYGEKTNEFVFAVVDRMIDEITPEKYNFIVESAMKSPNTAFLNTASLKPLGYRIELAVMATNIDTAWQGTINRFEAAKLKYNKDIVEGVPHPEPPRPVPREFFELVRDNIENSFQLIYESKNEEGKPQIPVDDIYIYTRDGEVLYHMADTPDLNPVPILSARLKNTPEEAEKIISEYKKNVLENKNSSSVREIYKKSKLPFPEENAYYIDGVTKEQAISVSKAGIPAGYNSKVGIIVVNKEDADKVKALLGCEKRGNIKR